MPLHTVMTDLFGIFDGVGGSWTRVRAYRHLDIYVHRSII